MRRHSVVLLLGMISLLPAAAQQIAVNRDNKTIAITAEDSVSVDPEIAVVVVGYENFATTKDSAYDDNVRVANKVSKALLDGGISKSAIQTEYLRLEQPEAHENWTTEERKQRQFFAAQTWTIYIAAANAQAVVDLALAAGANTLQNVDWNVSDPKALQAKAGAAALAKARTIAQQMANGLNVKLGDLVYASNRAPVTPLGGFGGYGLSTEATSMSVAPPPTPSHLLLYPKKVKADATVYAVFAIE